MHTQVRTTDADQEREPQTQADHKPTHGTTLQAARCNERDGAEIRH
jgi:hypothetical protein